MNLFELLKRGDTIPSWVALRGLGRSRLVNSAALFPVVGYYILYSESLRPYLALVPELDAGAGGSSVVLGWIQSWPRIHLLYLGMVAISIAALIFLVACPVLVKQYESARAYVAADTQKRSSYLVKFLVNEILRLPDHNRKWYENWISEINHTYGPIFEFPETVRTIEQALFEQPGGAMGGQDARDAHLETVGNAVMLMHFSIHNWSARFARLASTIFYILGFALIGASGFQIFVQVLLAIFR